MAEQEQPEKRHPYGISAVPRNKPLRYLITDQFRYQLMASTNNVDVCEQLRQLVPVPRLVIESDVLVGPAL